MEGVIGIIILVIVGIFAYKQVSSGNKFRDGAQQIVVGMSCKRVVEIMGQPSFVKNHADGSFEYVYEKSEWKGVFRGGTTTKRMEIVFSPDGEIISIGKNKHCDESGW